MGIPEAEATALAEPAPINQIVFSSHCKERILHPAQAFGLAHNDVQLAGISQLHAPYTVHRVPCGFHIGLFTLSGTARLEFEGRTHALDPHSVCLLTAGGSHRYQAENDWGILWFHLAATPRWEWLGRGGLRINLARNLDLLHRLAEEFLDRSVVDHPLTDRLLDLCAELMVSLLQQEFQFSVDPAHSVQRTRLDRIWQEVARHPEKPWSIDVLCAHAGCSRSWLQGRCMAVYAMSPGARLVDLRMSTASAYLVNTQLRLEEIAERVGYASSFSFSRVFKRKYGLSPAHYREREIANRHTG